MSKKYFQQAVTILLATLILVVGKGYGSLIHTCEEHGRHSHLLVNAENQTCEHEEHHHIHHGSEGGDFCNYEHETADLQFVVINAEPITKAALDFSAAWHWLPAATLSFTQSSIEVAVFCFFSTTDPPFFRRLYGRQLLAWVQSFLI